MSSDVAPPPVVPDALVDDMPPEAFEFEDTLSPEAFVFEADTVVPAEHTATTPRPTRWLRRLRSGS
jgi:hypothetical protein